MLIRLFTIQNTFIFNSKIKQLQEEVSKVLSEKTNLNEILDNYRNLYKDEIQKSINNSNRLANDYASKDTQIINLKQEIEYLRVQIHQLEKESNNKQEKISQLKNCFSEANELKIENLRNKTELDSLQSKIKEMGLNIRKKDDQLVISGECIFQLREELKLVKEHYKLHFESER